MVDAKAQFSPPLIKRNLQDFIPNREDKAVNLSVFVEFCMTGESLAQVSVQQYLVLPLLKDSKYYILFKERRSIDSVDPSIFLVSCRYVVKLVRIIGLQECNSLLQFVEIFSQNGVSKCIHKFSQILNVISKCSNAVWIYPLYVRGQRKRLWSDDQKSITYLPSG